jgi:hypothetical protein
LKISDDYLHILQLRRNEKILKSYWSTIVSKMNESKNFKNFLFTEASIFNVTHNDLQIFINKSYVSKFNKKKTFFFFILIILIFLIK